MMAVFTKSRKTLVMANEEQDIDAVRSLMQSVVAGSSVAPLTEELLPLLGAGKLLRARLALALGRATGMPDPHRHTCGAVIELAHLATLLHDDVIDNGVMRRGNPAFWVAKGTTGAILMGDYLLCRALSMTTTLGDMRLVATLVEMLQQVCDAELEQEMLLNDDDGWAHCLSVARRKTGSLFAFAATSAAGGDERLATILLESGFDLGTAYQLADDLLDANGGVGNSDKTLGQDARRGKLTAATFDDGDDIDPSREIERLLDRAVGRLQEWPQVREEWTRYADTHFKPVVDRFTSVEA